MRIHWKSKYQMEGLKDGEHFNVRDGKIYVYKKSYSGAVEDVYGYENGKPYWVKLKIKKEEE